MSDTLYFQVDMNIKVSHPHVYLQDIVKLLCTNSDLLNRLRILPIADLDPSRPAKYVLTAADLIDKIQRKEPKLTIIALGEPNFILTYDPSQTSHGFFKNIKIFFICFLSFFGSAFSIMTFNNDVNLTTLFHQIYKQVTGRASNGFTILEISFSIGIGLGVVFFFNHFGRKILTGDPTPLQVEMRQYEEDINKTVIEDLSRDKHLAE